MELSEFLLARIAEDEARIPDPWDRPHWAACNTQGDLSSLRDECDCGLPARVLAECEAKRAIVERWQQTAERLQVELGQTHGGWTLGLLALPYADHPDYDPEWRP